MKNDLKVLMLGPARNVKGGMTSVIDNYFKYGLDKKVKLEYVETINDKNKISKLLKEIKGRLHFQSKKLRYYTYTIWIQEEVRLENKI